MYFVGHRGAKGEAPENTMIGFKFAFDNGVRCFELDVHLTKDGELAVIHDDTLDRTTNGKGHIGGYTMDELKRFDAGVLFPETHSAAQIPCLEEVLTEYATKIELFEIEIKPDRPFVLDIVCKQLCDLLCDFNIADKTIITSFDPYAIKTVKAIMPNQRCGFISMFYKERIFIWQKSLAAIVPACRLRLVEARNLLIRAQPRFKGGWLVAIRFRTLMSSLTVVSTVLRQTTLPLFCLISSLEGSPLVLRERIDPFRIANI